MSRAVVPRAPLGGSGWVGWLALLTGLVLLLAATLWLRPAFPPPVFRVGIQPWPGYAPAYLARETGRWPEEIVRAVELPTDAETVRALRSGVLEAACLPLDVVLRMQEIGGDLRVVTVIDYSRGCDAVVAVPGRSSTLAGLKGQRVAVERRGGGMFVLALALRASGLRLSDVKVINADILEQPRLVRDALVDALVTYSPYKQQFVQAGCSVLWDSSQKGVPILEVLVVRADQFRLNPRAVRTLVTGWEGSAGQLVADPEAFAGAAAAMGMPTEVFATVWRDIEPVPRLQNRAFLSGESPVLEATIEQVNRDLVDFGLLRAPFHLDQIRLSPAEAEVLWK